MSKKPILGIILLMVSNIAVCVIEKKDTKEIVAHARAQAFKNTALKIIEGEIKIANKRIQYAIKHKLPLNKLPLIKKRNNVSVFLWDFEKNINNPSPTNQKILNSKNSISSSVQCIKVHALNQLEKKIEKNNIKIEGLIKKLRPIKKRISERKTKIKILNESKTEAKSEIKSLFAEIKSLEKEKEPFLYLVQKEVKKRIPICFLLDYSEMDTSY